MIARRTAQARQSTMDHAAPGKNTQHLGCSGRVSGSACKYHNSTRINQTALRPVLLLEQRRRRNKFCPYCAPYSRLQPPPPDQATVWYIHSRFPTTSLSSVLKPPPEHKNLSAHIYKHSAPPLSGAKEPSLPSTVNSSLPPYHRTTHTQKMPHHPYTRRRGARGAYDNACHASIIIDQSPRTITLPGRSDKKCRRG